MQLIKTDVYLQCRNTCTNTRKIMTTIEAPRLLPVGWAKDLAERCGVSRMTVTHAIRYGSAGEKAEKVREMYQKLYGSK